ncbi:hypothetical protein ACPPVO_01675 [Dactylosporangium sp. McL0621]|uniref:hypothetical protein n=1 Tax=Dactylosporangium sp. McL0621 TaxID=3415678 RepID=UPI003CF08486
MTGIGWQSQVYPPEGASAAEGIRNQLGRPELDLWTVLVREAAQNSWDARQGHQVVDFEIDMLTVSPAHAGQWRDLLLRDVPLNDHLPLRNALAAPVIRTLRISDRGTTGLGGPTRADQAVGEVRDFVTFVRNAGEPRDKHLGGGTYGFGKGIFYLLSRSGTILIHTRCQGDHGLETRLIGCALWRSYTADRREGPVRHTGRHWWGDRSADDVVEPLVGEDADRTARLLGLRQFGADETGTTIVIVDPVFGDDEPEDVARYLADTIAWQLWPKILPLANGDAPMRFAVRHENVSVEIPDPASTAPLNLFVEAYRKSRSDHAHRLSCYRPKRELGSLGLARRLMLPAEGGRASETAGLNRGVHHVCLMRPAELVVKYYAGPKPLSEHIGYAGVFRADESLDDVYAKAEPPTHDNWIADQLEGSERTFVRMTFTRIGEELEQFNNAGAVARSGSAAVALGAASSMFSGLVAGGWGIGGATDYGGGTQASNPPSSVAQRVDLAEDRSDKPLTTGSAPGGWQEFDGQTAESRATGFGSSDGNGWTEPQDERLTGGPTESLRAPASETRPPGPRPAVRPVVRYDGEPRLDQLDGRPVVVQEFMLPVDGAQVVSAVVNVVIAGSGSGRESQPPAAADMPTVLGWRGSDGRFVQGDQAEVEGGDGIVWQAILRPAPNTITEVAVTVGTVISR